MSEWIDVTADDLSLSDDKSEFHINYGDNEFGNLWVFCKTDDILKVLIDGKVIEADRDRWKERCKAIEHLYGLKSEYELMLGDMTDSEMKRLEFEISSQYCKWQKLMDEMEAGQYGKLL